MPTIYLRPRPTGILGIRPNTVRLSSGLDPQSGRATPYKHTFGMHPDISHLRIFGCAALAYKEKEKRHKLDYKTEECITGFYPHT